MTTIETAIDRPAASASSAQRRQAAPAIHVERFLQVAVATTAALATIMLGMGEGDPTLAVLAVIVAASSIYMTDVTGWIRLRGMAANLAAVGAVLLGFWQSGGILSESRLLEMSHVVVYLQFILLYQEKTPRRYWLLLVVGVVQTAVAAALNTEATFGLVLGGYLLATTFAMSLLFIVSESRRAGRLGRVKDRGGAPSDVAPQCRWPLARGDGGAPWGVDEPTWNSVLSWEFCRRSTALWFSALAMTALVFLVTPRLRETAREAAVASVASVQQSGVSETVTLGTFGEILENPDRVMRVRFFAPESDEPLELVGEPLFRGFVVRDYEEGTGNWSQGSTGKPHRDELEDSQILMRLVSQEINIEPLETSLLFFVAPPRYGITHDGVTYDPNLRQLRRSHVRQRSRFTYRLWTEGIQDRQVLSLVPSRERFDDEGDHRWLTRLPFAPDSVVHRVAADAVADSGAVSRFEQARALERYLRHSGRFSYSLRRTPGDPTLDPVVDFLTEEPSGHCEYFASALTLLLRARGIPAQLVIGYKGGEFNAIGNFYQVRQLHAHAWVEAYLAPHELPGGLPGDPWQWDKGGWMILDPTPGAATLATSGSWLANFPVLQQLNDYLQFIWSSYVVGLNRQRQIEEIYRPLLRAVKALFDVEFWSKAAEQIPEYIASGEWFNWRAGLWGMFVTGVVIGLWRLFSWLPSIFLSWIRRRTRQAAMRRRHEVDFYRRLESLLAHGRWNRTTAQTPREFAAAAQRSLAASRVTAPAAFVPPEVVEAYYEVRFGNRALDAPRIDAIERGLDRLELALENSQEQDARA